MRDPEHDDFCESPLISALALIVWLGFTLFIVLAPMFLSGWLE